MPSLLRKRIEGFDELVAMMSKDKRPSIFVTRDQKSFDEFKNKNLTCIDITLEPSRTFIASCN
jgi:hypothetical protein